MWRQLGDCGQVKAAVTKHGQEHRVLPRGAGYRDSQVGLGFRQVEHLGAVREHRRSGFAGVEAPRIHLGDVGDHVRFDVSRTRQEVAKATQELIVRKRAKRG